MKIAVNTRLLLKNKLEGIGWFTYESLKRITKEHPEHTFYFIFDRPYNEEFIFSDNIIPVVLSPQARHPFLFIIWFEISVKLYLSKLKPDIFLSPDGYLPLSSKIPSLAVIHDINFEHYPKDFPWIIKKYYKWFFPRFTRKASRIATVSEFSKNDISKKYSIDLNKIDVVYNGVNDTYKVLSENEILISKEKFANGKQYFIFIGSLIPRKNLENLFNAFDNFKKTVTSDVCLLIVGEKKWWTKNIAKAFNKMEYKSDVIFCGRLEPKELNQALSSSLALVYISYFEGFGIPIIEAFKCGTAVITSNVTSMPEIAGDAAIFVDPFNIIDISKAMNNIYSDKNLRSSLIEKGFIQMNKFSWDFTAQKLWLSIEKTISTK